MGTHLSLKLKIMKKLFALFILSGALLSTSASAFQVTQYSLNVGDKYEAQSTLSQEISQTVMGNSQNISVNAETVEHLEVISAENGEYTIKLTTLTQKTKTVTPMGSIDLDSEDPSSGGGIGEALNFRPYTFTIDKYGTILNIDGLDELREGLSESLQSNPTVLATVLQLFTDDVIETNLKTRFSIYSKSGETSWTEDTEVVTGGMPTNMSTTYTYNGNNVIESDSKITAKGTINNGGVDVELDLSGTQSNKVTVYDNGMPKSVDSSGDISGNGKAMGMQIPMTITTSATATITKQ